MDRQTIGDCFARASVFTIVSPSPPALLTIVDGESVDQ